MQGHASSRSESSSFVETSEIRPLNSAVSSKIRGSVVAPSFTWAMLELILNAIDAGATRICVAVDIHNFFLQV
jgi:DNA mismatch repair ATPase MutL